MTARFEIADTGGAAAAIEQNTLLRVRESSDGALLIELPDKSILAGDVESVHRESTFVIDFDEWEVKKLTKQVHAEFGDDVTAEELSRFVYDHIENKRYGRGFDLASRVAERAEGDCTEHAVLLTALARATGFPSRVVFGNLLVSSDGRVRAFGHAWTEIHDGENWQLLDATLPQIEYPEAWLRYLPTMGLDDEGPGCSMSMMRYATVMPSSISLTED